MADEAAVSAPAAATAPPKPRGRPPGRKSKKRGRPPGSKNKAKKRGRPPGSKNKKPGRPKGSKNKRGPGRPPGKRRGRPPGRTSGSAGLVSSLKGAVKLAGAAEAILGDDLAMRVHGLPKAMRAVVEAVLNA